MVDRSILFILGAGASKPFGFPLGSELVNDVYKSLEYTPLTKQTYEGIAAGQAMLHTLGQVEVIDEETRSDNKLVDMLLQLGYDREYIETFRTHLINSQLNSIDAFLEHRTEFIPLGKMAIAYNLLKYENEESLMRIGDWYRYLWNKMSSSFSQFQNNRLSFVTFNYDRSLEYFLLTAMSSLYGKSREESAKKLRSLEIVHVHGQLGSLPEFDEKNGIAYGEVITDKDRLKQVGDSIKIIHDKIENADEFKRAQTLIAEIYTINFLGFGYSQTNLDRLNTNHYITKFPRGTRLGLTNNETIQIQLKNKNLTLTQNSGFDCLQFLRNEVQFD